MLRFSQLTLRKKQKQIEEYETKNINIILKILFKENGLENYGTNITD